MLAFGLLETGGVKDERKGEIMFVACVFDCVRLGVCEGVHRKRFLEPLIIP